MTFYEAIISAIKHFYILTQDKSGSKRSKDIVHVRNWKIEIMKKFLHHFRKKHHYRKKYRFRKKLYLQKKHWEIIIAILLALFVAKFIFPLFIR